MFDKVKKDVSVTVKLSNNLKTKLETIMENYDMKRTDAIRLSINQLYRKLEDKK
jgi:predicted transcriptional regulator